MVAVMQRANEMVLTTPDRFGGGSSLRKPDKMSAAKAVKSRQEDNVPFAVHSLSDVKLPEHVLVERVIDITADPSPGLKPAFKFFGKLPEDYHAGTIVLPVEEYLLRTAPLGRIVTSADAATA